MNLKIWDLRKAKSICSAEVSKSITKNLAHLHKTESLDDEWFLSVSHDGQYIATGSYDKSAHIIDK